MPNRQKDTLAYVTHWNTRWGWRGVPAHDQAYLGAQKRSAELGYQLEHFWLGEPGMTARRLSSMFYHRNITGVLLASHNERYEDLSEIDWSRLCAVKIGNFPQCPVLHCVTDDHHRMARGAVQHALAAGFKRVGLVLAPWWDDTAEQAWSNGFVAEQNHLPAEMRIPILRVSGDQEDWAAGRPAQPCSTETSALTSWYQLYRPDVILGFSPFVLRQLAQIGLSVPQDVAYVDLCLENTDANVAGYRQNCEDVGEIAVATLIGQLQQNSIGIPQVPTTVLVGGTWNDGLSLPTVRQLNEPWSEENKVPVEEFAGAMPLTA
jgi:LacI family transcriptional regulator